MKAIKYYTLFIFVVFFSSVKTASAVVINCEVNNFYPSWQTVDTTFSLTVGNSNLGDGRYLDDYTVLYSISRVNVGMVSGGCNDGGTGRRGLYYTMLSSNYGPAIRTTGTETIYPTSVPGIGISVNSINNANAPVSLYPNALLFGGGEVYGGNGGTGLGFWISAKIWKIPGPAPQPGVVTFDGPTVGQLFMSSGNTFTSSDARRIWDGGTGWIASSRRLQGSFVIRPMTCDVVVARSVVTMGTFDASGASHSSEFSPWQDASFRLNCPNAYGYGGSARATDSGYTYPNNIDPNATMTANTINPVSVQVVPRNVVLDGINGIMALNAGGAEGYGLQLAWGDSAALGSGVPARPVQFSTWVGANSLNSAYRTTIAPGGQALPVGADGTIKMAARYVRTSGVVQPGPANATVEVIASYQ